MYLRSIGLVLVASSLALAGCAKSKSDNVADKARNDKKLVIGVKYDQPGLGLKSPSGVVGFDVDVATYIAHKMGATKVEFKEARSANRETFLANGTVDMVIATYSITAARLPKVTFGGPYIVTHQDIMTRANTTSIKSLTDLAGQNLCQVSGSNSWKNVVDGTNKLNQKVAAKLVPASGYEECVTKLKGGTVDAVSTDGTILAGFSAREPGQYRIANAPFTDERYGVGLKKGDLKGCAAVNSAISAMYSDGTMRTLWTKWFGPTGLTFDVTRPPAQGCA